jgi:hypothetical protein
MADENLPSFNEQLRRLKKGESLSKVERITLDELCGSHEDVNDRLARMRRTINAQVSRIRDKEAGSNFRVESAACLTNDNDAMLAVVAVTRT